MSHPSARYDSLGNLHLYSPLSNNCLSPRFPYPSNYPTWLSPRSNAVSPPLSSPSSNSPSFSSALFSPPSTLRSSTLQKPPKPLPIPFPTMGVLLVQHTQLSPANSPTRASSTNPLPRPTKKKVKLKARKMKEKTESRPE